jgi:hypothetical protein
MGNGICGIFCVQQGQSEICALSAIKLHRPVAVTLLIIDTVVYQSYGRDGDGKRRHRRDTMLRRMLLYHGALMAGG